jgi:hypothetical protein
MEIFNSVHETVKKGVSPGSPPKARNSSAVQRDSDIKKRSLNVDEKRLATSLSLSLSLFLSLSCNNLRNNPQRLTYEAGLCILVFKGFQDRTK